MPLRVLELVDAAVRDTAELAQAARELFSAQVPALAVVDAEDAVVGIFSEADLLRAVFPGYLAELRHTAFIADDPAALEERARAVRGRPVSEFAREVEPLDARESQMHAAERFMHTGEQALPVVEAGRFVGMLSIAALCHARLDRLEDR